MVASATRFRPFSLGRVLATPGALDLLGDHEVNPASLLLRHQSGDWGDVCSEDAEFNRQATQDGSRILSSYAIGDGKVWVITEGEDEEGRRAATTILLPEEY